MRDDVSAGRSLALYNAILRIKDLDECVRFFDDLCAVTELRTLEQRYDVACCLLEGKVYSEIRRETGASSATVSRVNRMLNYGTGCFADSVRYDLAQRPQLKEGGEQHDSGDKQNDD
ncbi:MAG: YerC/YecD family TrpR-related protein [Gemmiger sp.]